MEIYYNKVRKEYRKGVMEISPVSEAKKKANKKWDAANLKHFGFAVPIDEAEMIEKYCKENKISKNSFFRKASMEKIEREK